MPLPSITFCPYNNINRNLIDLHKLDDQIQSAQNTSIDWIDVKNILSLLCDPHNVFTDPPNVNMSSKQILSQMKELSMEQSCTFTLYALRLNFYEKCEESIQRIVTHDGICYVYNQLPAAKIYQPNM